MKVWNLSKVLHPGGEGGRDPPPPLRSPLGPFSPFNKIRAPWTVQTGRLGPPEGLFWAGKVPFSARGGGAPRGFGEPIVPFATPPGVPPFGGATNGEVLVPKWGPPEPKEGGWGGAYRDPPPPLWPEASIPPRRDPGRALHAHFGLSDQSAHRGTTRAKRRPISDQFRAKRGAKLLSAKHLEATHPHSLPFTTRRHPSTF